MQPGWYPDPSDQRFLRYWDGYAWSEHQAPVGTRAATTPVKKKSSAGLVIGILAVAALLIGLLSWAILSSDFFDEVNDAVRDASTPMSSPGDTDPEKACLIERRTIITAFEAYRGQTGAYPTSYEAVSGTGENAFLAESPADHFVFAPDPQAYRDGTQGIGPCEGY